MIVFVNNQEQSFAADLTVNGLLSAIQINSPKGIALAINDSIVPKSKWNEYTLKENDKITIIKATQGG